MKNIFKSKWTKWIPIGRFTFSNQEYVVMGRRHTGNGLLGFKTIRVNHMGGSFAGDLCHPILPSNVLDVQKQWDILTGEWKEGKGG